jgi:hypothetical protein
MNKVNTIQQAIDEYKGKIDEANEKYRTLSEEYEQKIKFYAEKIVNGDRKITVDFGVKPPIGHVILMDIKTDSGNRIVLDADEGKALYEILKELYE